MHTDLNNQSVLVTGGTGSFGKAFIQSLLQQHPQVKRVIVFSRDEQKHFEMMNELPMAKFPCLQYMLGDVRDRERVLEISRGVDIIVHAAAMKHVPVSEMNPMECIKTNVLGSQNIIDAAFEHKVKTVVALSTDKAASPVNFYGASKLCLEKLFIYAGLKTGQSNTSFSVVRYANVFGSKGSVVPLFLKKRNEGVLPITHPDMTRFSITMQNAIDLVYFALQKGWGGEIILPISPSYKVSDIATAIAPQAQQQIIGARAGEKMHEMMFTENDAPNTVRRDNYYIICPANGQGTWSRDEYCKKTGATLVADEFAYVSNRNDSWLSVSDIRKMVKELVDPGFNLS
jgi:UDP-N-acetylglucosamine 4,6-dehydratase (inverting)